MDYSKFSDFNELRQFVNEHIDKKKYNTYVKNNYGNRGVTDLEPHTLDKEHIVMEINPLSTPSVVKPCTVRICVDNEIRFEYNGRTKISPSKNMLVHNLQTFHNSNVERVNEDVSNSPYEGIELLVWREGSVEQAERQSVEDLQRYDLPDQKIEAVASYETRRERRIANDEPTSRVKSLTRKIPHISDSVKDAVIEKFITIEQLADASLSELQSVDGVGRKTAWKIQRFAQLDQKQADKQISDEKTVERVEAMKEFALDKGLISEVVVNGDLQSYRGRIYYPDNNIKLNDDLERGGFERESGEESLEQVLAHEIAHTLENKHGRRGRIDPDELMNLSDDAVIELRYLKRVAESDSRRQRNEVFTNFVSRLAVEPEKTEALFPNAVREFRTKIIPQATGTKRELLELVTEKA
jgi:predicted SprT family Zn-dependent metalloprotease